MVLGEVAVAAMQVVLFATVVVDGANNAAVAVGSGMAGTIQAGGTVAPGIVVVMSVSSTRQSCHKKI